MKRFSRIAWAATVVSAGGCTAILGVDNDYKLAGSTTGTGSPVCDAAYTCAEALDGDPTKFCDGPHRDLYDAYYACTCVSDGACFLACSDNACTNGMKSADCTACLQDNATGCAKELEACAGDSP